MRLQGPGNIEFREVRYGDEAAVAEILSDWEHGFTGARLRPDMAVHKWVNDMRVEPGDHPCTPDSSYREALISFTPTGDPLALIVYVVRGANDPKNDTGENILQTETWAVAPAQRGRGNSTELLETLIRSAFEDTGVDRLIHDLVDVPAMEAHRADRRYSVEEPMRETPRGNRMRVELTSADHRARMADSPDRARRAHIFERNG